MSLQAKLDAFRTNFEAGGPPYHAPDWVHEPMHRATRELIESGAAARALKVGDQAPDFTLKDSQGDDVSSATLLATGPLIVSFYRGVWCPYCNMDLQALQAALPEFGRRGAGLVAISPQSAANSRKSRRDNRVTFPILSDPGNEVAANFGIRFKLPDYLIEVYKNAFKNDLAVINADPSWTLPMPSRFVIGRDRRIRYAEVNPDYTRRPEPEDLLSCLEEPVRA
jgi:peroxiredoxin